MDSENTDSNCFNPRSRTGNDRLCNRRIKRHVVSIHVPARGTTAGRFSGMNTTPGFNPRSRTGNDPFRTYISTPCLQCFNPRSRTGNDDISNELEIWRNAFQSTFPHGERRSRAGSFRNTYTGFNPRSRTGNDYEDLGSKTYSEGFNPRSRTGNDIF